MLPLQLFCFLRSAALVLGSLSRVARSFVYLSNANAVASARNKDGFVYMQIYAAD